MGQVRLPGFHQHYLEQGSGEESVVFVHGFISSHRWWLPTLRRLPERFRAYAIDLRGAGESSDAEAGYTLAQFAEDLEAFTAALELERFTLVGHSLGGGVAMEYALTHPQRLKALILVDPLAPRGTDFPPEVTAWINAQQGTPEGIRPLVLGAFAMPPAGVYLEQLIQDGVRWGKAIYLSTMDDMARFDVADRLGEIQTPTLVTWGDQDTVIPFAGIVDTFTRIPGCALQVWHGVGHSAPIEVPDQFVHLLDRFIAEVGA